MTNDYLEYIDFGGEKDFSDILTNPFLDIAARFWEPDRYAAFQVCYRSMRRLDDLVDDRKVAGSPITADEKARYRQMMEDWLESLRENRPIDAFQTDILSAMNRFAIPTWPWERLCKAMLYDLDHNGFDSFRLFLRYAEGAAIAPASVFTHLCGVRKQDDSNFVPPAYDIRQAARALAIFSYLVHIVRDFQKDQVRGLNYFADAELVARKISLADMRRTAEGGPVFDQLRDLIGLYKRLADYYREKARAQLDLLAPHLKPRYQLSMEIIYGLYHLVFERIEPETGLFTEEELNPTPAEIQERLADTVDNFKSNNSL
jgi:phytoene synthase